MKARTFAKKMIDMIKSPEMRVLPGQLAFFIVMALIPLVAIIRVIATKLGIKMGTVVMFRNFEEPQKILTGEIKISGAKNGPLKNANLKNSKIFAIIIIES